MLITEERESINLFEQIIQQGKNSLKPQFKEITIEDREILNPYFDLVDYEACEYNFNTLYMWQHAYKTAYHIGDNFAVLVGEYEGEVFSILPLAKKEDLPEPDNPVNTINLSLGISRETFFKLCTLAPLL